MTLFPVHVDVYHKEQLVTEEEAEEAASDVWRWEERWEWRWVEVAITKDVVTAARIGDILEKHECNKAKYIRGTQVCTLICVYKHCTGSI